MGNTDGRHIFLYNFDPAMKIGARSGVAKGFQPSATASPLVPWLWFAPAVATMRCRTASERSGSDANPVDSLVDP